MKTFIFFVMGIVAFLATDTMNAQVKPSGQTILNAQDNPYLTGTMSLNKDTNKKSPSAQTVKSDKPIQKFKVGDSITEVFDSNLVKIGSQVHGITEVFIQGTSVWVANAKIYHGGERDLVNGKVVFYPNVSVVGLVVESPFATTASLNQTDKPVPLPGDADPLDAPIALIWKLLAGLVIIAGFLAYKLLT